MPVQHIYRPSPTGEGLFYGWFSAMHTRFDIAMSGGMQEQEMVVLTERIRKEVLHLESVGNYFDESSELSQVNRYASIHPVEIGDELYEMISMCRNFHALTMKCFDVTFRSCGHHPDLIDEVIMDKERRSIFFRNPDICIDLSGFIKGYALDKVRALLKDAGVVNALVNFGNSSIMAMGDHPNGSGWKLMDDYTLHDQCLTVSGNDSDERRHIVAPSDGKYVEGRDKVFVVTESASVGEALSTGLFAATVSGRPVLLESLGPLVIKYKSGT